MSATSRIYVMLEQVRGGVTRTWGSLRSAIGEATIPDQSSDPDGETLIVPASVNATNTGSMIVYDRTRDGPFDRFVLLVHKPGYCYLDILAGGRWYSQPDLSCDVPWVICADQTLTAASDAAAVADSGGFPARYVGTLQAANIDKIAVRNASTTATVEIERVRH